jgi:hypothetical protein
MDEKKQIEEMANILWHIPFGYSLNSYNDCEMIAECIYNDGGYRKQSEWISVDERLPTEQKEFLAYYGFDNGDGDLGMMFTGVLTYFACDKRPHFQHEDLRLRVTHWMPLPEAPKMKGGEE